MANVDIINVSYKLFDLDHFSFNRNKTQTAATNICLNCKTFINLTFPSSEMIIIQLQINLNSRIQLYGLVTNKID